MSYGEAIDYSPVVILWFKAFELEIKKYFFDDLKLYISKIGLQDNTVFPKGITREILTIGSLEHIIKSVEYNKTYKILDHYFLEISTLTDAFQLRDFFIFFVTEVSNLNIKFRIPVAHTDEMNLENAILCFETLIEIKKVFLSHMKFIK